jgi:hypothetical protein
MPFKQSEMLYDDGKYYKWKAAADKDNPYYRAGIDHSELNKTEGYEVLYFINHLGKKWSWTDTTTRQKVDEPSLNSYRKLERMIKAAPARATHKALESWILMNWNNY